MGSRRSIRAKSTERKEELSSLGCKTPSEIPVHWGRERTATPLPPPPRRHTHGNSLIAARSFVSSVPAVFRPLPLRLSHWRAQTRPPEQQLAVYFLPYYYMLLENTKTTTTTIRIADQLRALSQSSIVPRKEKRPRIIDSHYFGHLLSLSLSLSPSRRLLLLIRSRLVVLAARRPLCC